MCRKTSEQIQMMPGASRPHIEASSVYLRQCYPGWGCKSLPFMARILIVIGVRAPFTPEKDEHAYQAQRHGSSGSAEGNHTMRWMRGKKVRNEPPAFAEPRPFEIKKGRRPSLMGARRSANPTTHVLHRHRKCKPTHPRLAAVRDLSSQVYLPSFESRSPDSDDPGSTFRIHLRKTCVISDKEEVNEKKNKNKKIASPTSRKY